MELDDDDDWLDAGVGVSGGRMPLDPEGAGSSTVMVIVIFGFASCRTFCPRLLPIIIGHHVRSIKLWHRPKLKIRLLPTR